MNAQLRGKSQSSRLFNQVVSFGNLHTAYKKAASGCRKNQELARFNFHLEKELISLQNELISGGYTPAFHRYFTIYDPKRRTIAVAPFRDRVVHHAVVNVLEPLFEKRFIFDSYASRKEKGTHAAAVRAQTFCRRRPWYGKADIEKYFESMDHAVLLKALKRKIKDNALMVLIEKIVFCSPTPSKGVPIGNLTSQFFANVYLDLLDHYMKDELGIRCYIRYMDDFLIFGWSKRQTMDRLEKANAFLQDTLLLTLKDRVTRIDRSTRGVSFLGMGIYPGTIRVWSKNRRRSMKRISANYRRWCNGEIDETTLANSLESVMAHLTHFSTMACELR